MRKVTPAQVKKTLETHWDEGVREIGLSGRVPQKVLHELLATHIPDDISSFDFRYVGRGRSKSDALMLIVTRKERTTKSVIKCGPIPELNVEKRKWRFVQHLEIRPTRLAGRATVDGFTSVQYSLASGDESALTFADALLNEHYSVADLDRILRRTFDALYQWNGKFRPSSKHPFQFPWREQALEKIQQELISHESTFGAAQITRLCNLTNLTLPNNWLRTTLLSHRAICHGDLNTGNLLVGVDKERHISPCLIDFTWVTSKFAPSLDYAKLERDIRVRCLRKADNEPTRYSEALEVLDNSLVSESPATARFASPAVIKCIHAINTIRSQYNAKFPTDEDRMLAGTEYLFHLLCWMLSYFDASEYTGLQDDHQREIIKSSLRVYDLLDNATDEIRRPARPLVHPVVEFASPMAPEIVGPTAPDDTKFNLSLSRESGWRHRILLGLFFLIIVGVALILTVWKPSHPDAVMHGVLKDISGKPLPHVTIGLAAFPSEAVTTSPLGEFSLPAHAQAGQTVRLAIFNQQTELTTDYWPVGDKVEVIGTTVRSK